MRPIEEMDEFPEQCPECRAYLTEGDEICPECGVDMRKDEAEWLMHQ